MNHNVGISNIIDTVGFKKKVSDKIDEMSDPANIQMFTLFQSNYLY
jgi:hypothetical protein